MRTEESVLVVVDVQGKLASCMHEHEEFFKKLEIIVQAVRALDIPILAVEQIPEKLGPTIDAVKKHLAEPEAPIIAKSTFSALGNAEFVQALASFKRKKVLLCGIESHICVYQTAVDLMRAGFELHVVSDAVASRDVRNKSLALQNLREKGANITAIEMLLFELMEGAHHPAFRTVQGLIK